ncbi:MAG TPA: heavy-metal-associated domain-containing protein [Mariniphaga anaerophila]|uniref:Heavy-metal-associated domain-containing protein n=1 Tax=Mariniphaga anaerophila TaxID=1484053 RepID=A0A831PQ44_9BACT|nr:heavy-metal-associated domain-containing protein [Mariniphaga anaerophila]
MKQFGILLMILMLGGLTSEISAQKKGRAVVCFQSDMDCINCEETIYEHLRFEKGVKDLKVDHVSNTIFIEFVEKRNDEKELAKVIEKKGFKADKITREKYNDLLEQVKEHGHEHDHETHRERN